MNHHIYDAVLEEFKNSQTVSDTEILIYPKNWEDGCVASVIFKKNKAIIHGATALDKAMAEVTRARGKENGLLYGETLYSIAGGRLNFDGCRFTAEINFSEFFDCHPSYEQEKGRLCEVIRSIIDAEKNAKSAKEQYLMKWAG